VNLPSRETIYKRVLAFECQIPFPLDGLKNKLDFFSRGTIITKCLHPLCEEITMNSSIYQIQVKSFLKPEESIKKYNYLNTPFKNA